MTCRLLHGHRRETLSASAGEVTWMPQVLPHGHFNQSRFEDLRIWRTCASVESNWMTVGLGDSEPNVTKHEMD
ncbi:MAG: hypothetical protein F4103_02595 [Boseongicola sp. SB0673_bin_14]|nr:hypothetical protein [Boseongicola sp. SB0673_bin_14]